MGSKRDMTLGHRNMAASLRRWFRATSLELVVPVLLVATWWWASASTTSPYFPPLSDILGHFFSYWFGEGFIGDILPSLGRVLGGFLVGSCIGIVAGLMLGLSRVLRRLFDPLINFARAIPGTALIPVAIFAIGIGEEMRILVIAFVCMWPVLLNTMDAIDDRDPVMVATARIYRLSPLQRLWKIVLPGAAPRIASGMRVALPIAIVVMLTSEMVASLNGVGYFTIRAQRQFDSVAMWSGVILLGLLGYLLSVAFARIERRALSWHYEMRLTE